MESFTTQTSALIPLLVDHVDTDQIIPARFLKIVDKEGLADKLFADWRTDPEFVLNRPEMAGRTILLAGDNFGCGSSREHAPWALRAWGIRAIIARSFADIFRGNAYKNGLLPIALSAEEHDVVRRSAQLQIDLESQTVVVDQLYSI